MNTYGSEEATVATRKRGGWVAHELREAAPALARYSRSPPATSSSIAVVLEVVSEERRSIQAIAPE